MSVNDPIEKRGVTRARFGYEQELRIVIHPRQHSGCPDDEPLIVYTEVGVVIQNGERVALGVRVITKHVQNKWFVAFLQKKNVIARQWRSNHLDCDRIVARQMRVTDRQFQYIHTLFVESRVSIKTGKGLNRDGPRSTEL